MTTEYIRVGYLGPKGSFAHMAALKIHADQYISYLTIPELFAALRKLEINKVVAPFDNSTEGSVGQTVDEIIGAEGYLNIEQMIVLPIKQNLVFIGNIEEIQTVISHPQALSQCAMKIGEMKIKTESYSSTSAAIKKVMEKNNPAIAAIGNLEAINLYANQDLNWGIKEDFQDFPDNHTRFVVVEHIDNNAYNGGSKTEDYNFEYIMTFRVKNESGELQKIQSLISSWKINMVKIITRPSRANKPPLSTRMFQPHQKIKTNGKSAIQQFEDDSFLIIIQGNKNNSEIISSVTDFLREHIEDFYIYGHYFTAVS